MIFRPLFPLAITVALGTGLLFSVAHAGSATLAWDPSPESDLRGYRIYYGTSPRTADCPPGGYANRVEVTRTVTSYTVPNLANGETYYFSVSAFDTAGNESCFSNEEVREIPQGTPTQGGSGFSIGDAVVALLNVNVRSSPAISAAAPTANLLGTQPAGARGRIAGGPEFNSGYTWWNVDYDVPPDGWSIESALSRAGVGTSTPSAGCDTLQSFTSSFRARRVEAETRTRALELARDQRLRDLWQRFREREAAQIASFEALVARFLDVQRNRIGTDPGQGQEFAAFEANVRALLAERVDVLQSSLAAAYNAALRAVDERKTSGEQALIRELRDLDALIEDVLAKCGAAFPLTTARATFLKSHAQILRDTAAAQSAVWRAYRATVGPALSLKRTADAAAKEAYLTAYRAAWSAYLTALRAP